MRVIANTGYTFPLKRITVNLAPADVRKDESAFDLPIGILAATEQTAPERLVGAAFAPRVAGKPALKDFLRSRLGYLSLRATSRHFT